MAKKKVVKKKTPVKSKTIKKKRRRKKKKVMIPSVVAQSRRMLQVRLGLPVKIRAVTDQKKTYDLVVRTPTGINIGTTRFSKLAIVDRKKWGLFTRNNGIFLGRHMDPIVRHIKHHIVRNYKNCM